MKQLNNILTFFIGVPTSIGLGIEALTAQLNLIVVCIGIVTGMLTMISLIFIIRSRYYKMKHDQNVLKFDERELNESKF